MAVIPDSTFELNYVAFPFVNISFQGPDATRTGLRRQQINLAVKQNY
ncbi:MAG: hypothetical protein ACE5D2_06420 [Fidelibacterota bacterium]